MNRGDDAEKIAAVKRMFNQITPRYDLLNRILSGRQDIRWRRFAVKRIPEDAGYVLDVATGTGDLALEIARMRPGADVVGLDFVPRMLNSAMDKTAAAGYGGRIRYLIGDAMRLPFADDHFDAAAIAFGLRNIPDRLGAIREMSRVVKPGGKVITLEMTFPENLRMKFFFRWYLKNIIPALGRLISGNLNAYSYLSDSIHLFLPPEELSRIMLKAGLVNIQAHPLSLGITCLHEGIAA